MKKQLYFYLIEDDYKILDEVIRIDNGVIINLYHKNLPHRIVHELNDRGNNEWLSSYIVSDSELNRVEFVKRESSINKGEIYYGISERYNPVIEIIRGVYNKEKRTLKPSRIYFATHNEDKTNLMGVDTLRLGMELYKTIRKKFIPLKGDYKGNFISKNALNLVENNQLSLDLNM